MKICFEDVVYDMFYVQESLETSGEISPSTRKVLVCDLLQNLFQDSEIGYQGYLGLWSKYGLPPPGTMSYWLLKRFGHEIVRWSAASAARAHGLALGWLPRGGAAVHQAEAKTDHPRSREGLGSGGGPRSSR